MGLTPGNRIGPYEILSPLGAGGMGEVYRARDTKLNREVALKVLPAAMANDAERMARFQREAQVLASLNHTSIASIYGLEDSGGVRALVMELVEGPTLAEVLEKRKSKNENRQSTPGPAVSFDSLFSNFDPLPIAKQIAEALEFAHERGIIHRDLKPANVKITPDGAVKVLDFGLAKALATEASGTNLANSPTISIAATQAGVILGTAAYMSPEQAKGKSLDRRTDIWAFGCVLYEMLAGKQAFEGETVSDVLAAVIMKDPAWNMVPDATPASIRNLLRRCLEKDSKRRLRDIGEVRITIDETLSGAGTAKPDAPLLAEEGRREARGGELWRRALPWALALVFAFLFAALVWKSSLRQAVPQTEPVVSFVPAPPGTSFRFFGFGAGPVVVSPDGKQLAFSATNQDGVTKIWVRPLNSTTAAPVPGTDDGASIFWSPDSRSLGFYANGKLKTIEVAGGNVQVLADASPFARSDWGPSGIILFKPQRGNEIFKIPASGGTPVAATRLGKDEANHHAPLFLPDGEHFLYDASNARGRDHIAMASLDSTDSKLVLDGASVQGFAAGFLIFQKGSPDVFAQPFDPVTGNLSGKPVSLAQANRVSIAGESILAYQPASVKAHLQWFDRSGNPLGTLGEVAEYYSPKISPDGKHVLSAVVDPQNRTGELWSFPVSGGVSTRLTFGPGEKIWSVWSPDGKFIAYSGSAGENSAIFREPADGSGGAENIFPLSPNLRAATVVDWSPDNHNISYDVFDTKKNREESWILPLTGDKKPFQVTHADASQYDGNFSPDGRWFAYFSYESGRPEVYVVPFPGPGGKYQISHTGGWLVRWAKGGKLFYTTMGNRLMEADLALGASALQVKSIRPLFEMHPPNLSMPLFDVTSDGEKFVVVTSDQPESNSITLVTNWTSLLKR